MKVAYYSPLPPERSGIADYSALLLPVLERLVDVPFTLAPPDQLKAQIQKVSARLEATKPAPQVVNNP